MKKNILVVDDSALMRRAICDIINAGNDFEATDTCRDGLEAYEKIKNGSYAAVLLDINMPRMNGLELLQRLRKENIPATVIIVSSLAKEEAPVTLKALDYGALDFITKPTNIVEAKDSIAGGSETGRTTDRKSGAEKTAVRRQKAGGSGMFHRGTTLPAECGAISG